MKTGAACAARHPPLQQLLLRVLPDLPTDPGHLCDLPRGREARGALQCHGAARAGAPLAREDHLLCGRALPAPGRVAEIRLRVLREDAKAIVQHRERSLVPCKGSISDHTVVSIDRLSLCLSYIVPYHIKAYAAFLSYLLLRHLQTSKLICSDKCFRVLGEADSRSANESHVETQRGQFVTLTARSEPL